ncbi:MAG TPA: energy transducer TonB, partial [Flavobacterium sp.]|nr:energy transducer TonB [Flavobacterium sp.]
MSKLNIFNGAWIDMVFEGRNKKYGAYQLRSENPKTTMKALIIGAALFSFLVAIPKIYEAMGKLVPQKAEEEVVLVDMAELPPPP